MIDLKNFFIIIIKNFNYFLFTYSFNFQYKVKSFLIEIYKLVVNKSFFNY